jgi:RNA polymerase-interacting CarD/CdnL/TRCF family regulator
LVPGLDPTIAWHPTEKEIRVKLSVGKKVSYPSQGPCLVGPVVKRVVEGKLTEFYHFIILTDRGGELFVPVDKAQAKGIRKLLDKTEIPKLLDRLKKPSKAAEKWNQRTREHLILFTSGSAFDLAEIVGSLSELTETKVLTPSDRQTLERAKKLLACEISEVMGETKSAAEEKIDQALEGRKGNKISRGKAAMDWPEVEHYGEAL